MLGQDYYYSESIRNMVATFGHLFSDVHIKRRTKNGGLKDIKIPLHFANQEKVYLFAKDDKTNVLSLPRMGFEFAIAGVDDERKTSRNVVHNYGLTDGQAHWARNFVPYNFTFNLSIVSDDIEDSLQIIEQILPNFQPEMTIKIKPLKEYPDFVVDVPIELQDVQNEFGGLGTIMEMDTYNWNLSFLLRGYMFSPVQKDGIGIIDVASINVMDWFEMRDKHLATAP